MIPCFLASKLIGFHGVKSRPFSQGMQSSPQTPWASVTISAEACTNIPPKQHGFRAQDPWSQPQTGGSEPLLHDGPTFRAVIPSAPPASPVHPAHQVHQTQPACVSLCSLSWGFSLPRTHPSAWVSQVPPILWGPTSSKSSLTPFIWPSPPPLDFCPDPERIADSIQTTQLDWKPPVGRSYDIYVYQCLSCILCQYMLHFNIRWWRWQCRGKIKTK